MGHDGVLPEAHGACEAEGVGEGVADALVVVSNECEIPGARGVHAVAGYAGHGGEEQFFVLGE